MFKRIVTHKLAPAGVVINGNAPGDVKIHNPRVFRRAALWGTLGVGDSYADGDFTVCGDLSDFFKKWMRYRMRKRTVQLENSPNTAHAVEQRSYSFPDLAIRAKRMLSNQQDILRAKRVGERHYDIGNDLYEAMLGPTMAYSCAYWAGANTLDRAQNNKYRIICEKLDLKPGDTVLEVGCGWGGFAAYAARNYGVRVVGVSISKEQIKYVEEKFPDLCAAGKIDLRFMDYREIPEAFKDQKFDAIVSIGMFEHVGPDNYDDYMRIAWRVLKEHGKFLLHTIVGNGGADGFTWFRIFPGGILPREEQIAYSAKPYFVMEHMENFGYDYSRTLMAWWNNFVAAWPKLRATGRYDMRFYRMWEFYVKSSAESFRSRRIHLQQWMFAKGGVDEGYQWNRPNYQTA